MCRSVRDPRLCSLPCAKRLARFRERSEGWLTLAAAVDDPVPGDPNVLRPSVRGEEFARVSEHTPSYEDCISLPKAFT